MSWSADGKYIALSLYNEQTDRNTLWIVEAKPGAKLRRLASGSDPAFAPTGHQLAYSCDPMGKGRWDLEVRIADLDSRKTRTLRKKAHDPSWSTDGKEVALIDESKDDFTAIVEVVDAATGKEVSFRREAINVGTPLLSPDGRYIAYNPHMSRPKLEGVIEDRQTEHTAMLPYPGEPVLEWSPDSRWLLWTRFIIDPKNEGNYLWTEAWMTGVDGKESRKIGDGFPARFTPDGKHVLYRHVRGNLWHTRGDLYVADLQGRSQKRLVRRTDQAFAVWKPAPRPALTQTGKNK